MSFKSNHSQWPLIHSSPLFSLNNGGLLKFCCCCCLLPWPLLLSSFIRECLDYTVSFIAGFFPLQAFPFIINPKELSQRIISWVRDETAERGLKDWTRLFHRHVGPHYSGKESHDGANLLWVGYPLPKSPRNTHELEGSFNWFHLWNWMKMILHWKC